MDVIVPDALRIILLLVSDESLDHLYRTSSKVRSAIAAVLKNNLFWYERSQKLVRTKITQKPNSNWIAIYTNLARAEKHFADVAKHNSIPERCIRYSGDIPYTHIGINPYQYGIQDLDTLKAMVEVYGVPKWQYNSLYYNKDTLGSTWRSIRKVEVLAYLVDLGALDLKTSDVKYPLINAVVEGDTDSFFRMLSMVEVPSRSVMNDVVGAIINVGNLDIFEQLVDRYRESIPWEDALLPAVIKDNREIVDIILDNKEISPEYLQRMVEQAISSNSPEVLDMLLVELDADKKYIQSLGAEYASDNAGVLEVLLDFGLELNATKWRSILNRGIEFSNPKLVAIALDYISPVTKANTALKLAVKASRQSSASSSMDRNMEAEDSTAVLNLILDDERMDINAVLYDIIMSMNKDSSDNVMLIVRRPEVRIDTLTIKAIMKLLHYITNKELDQETMHKIAEAADTYHKVLRFIMLKKPTGKQLIRYMIGLKDKLLKQAAMSVLNHNLPYDEVVAPIRALLLATLYPEVRLEQHITYLEEDGYNENTLRASRLLIQAYLNPIKM